MTKITDIPAIRFKGFSDTWEQRKLGEIGSVSMCRRIFKEQTSENGEIPFYKIGTFGGEADAFISRELFEEYKAKYQYPKKGDILISASGSIGRTVVFTGKNEYFQDSNIVWLNHDKHLDNSFLKCFYSIVKWAGIEGSTIKRLYNDNILNTAITLPSVEEQQKIGAYFENLDNLITLHQCKCQIDGCRFQSPLAITWEQRKAIDIADYSKGNGYSKGDLTDAGTPIILYGRLYTKYQFAISEVDTFTVPRNGAVYSQGNEVIVPASGETADDIARASAVEKSGVLLGGDLNILRPFDFINPLFLALAISNGEPQKELAKKAQGKSVVHIHNTDIQEVTIAYPSRTEQDRIVSVFRQLDNLITLHQRKYDKLTNVKKSMLEKMFPQNGSNAPEIRFKGFTEAWEQRKLGDVVDVRSGKDYKHLSEGNIPVYGTGGFMLSVNQALSYDEDAIGIGRKGTIDKPYILKAPFWTVDTLFYAIPREKVDLNFAFDVFQNIDWKKKDESTGVPSLSKTAINEIDVLVPQYDEQQPLGQFFNRIDNLITLHQRKPNFYTGGYYAE